MQPFDRFVHDQCGRQQVKAHLRLLVCQAMAETMPSQCLDSNRLNTNSIKPGAVSYLSMHWLRQGLADAAAGLPNVFPEWGLVARSANTLTYSWTQCVAGWEWWRRWVLYRSLPFRRALGAPDYLAGATRLRH